MAEHVYAVVLRDVQYGVFSTHDQAREKMVKLAFYCVHELGDELVCRCRYLTHDLSCPKEMHECLMVHDETFFVKPRNRPGAVLRLKRILFNELRYCHNQW